MGRWRALFGLRERDEYDELAKVRFFMNWMKIWPGYKHAWWHILYILVYMGSLSISTVLETLFIVTEARTADPLMLLQVVVDIFGTGGVAFKGYFIRRRAKQVLEIDNILATDFAPLEKNHVAVKLKNRRIVWITVVAHGLLLIASLADTLRGAMLPPETRQCSFRAPAFWNRNPFTFYTFACWWACGHFGAFATSSSLDSLIICLSRVIRNKSATLQNIISDFDSVKDTKRRDIELDNIIKHHTLLIKVYELAESVTNKPMLPQLMFIMLGIGTPTLQVLLADNLETSYAIFLFFYVFWVLTPFAVQFMLIDAATTSAGSIGFSAYSAYQPGMTKDQVGKLCVIIAKAQRPLTFTASKIVKINRRTMLKVVKQSYSICSGVLKLRSI